MAPCRPSHVVVYGLWADDLRGAARFYRDVIGLEPLSHHGDRPAFALGGGSHLVLIKGRPTVHAGEDAHPFPAIAFAVEDLDGAIAHLKALGIEMPWGVECGPRARWVKLCDPAGNLIELAELARQH
jgi:catechol 2,3-dioxygenase-like lactoylglutathione lyase family enzyme